MQKVRLARISLGGVGLEHLKNRLHEPGYPLRSALAELPLEEGEVWTWAPKDWKPILEELRDASLPAGISQRRHRDLLVAFVLKYLRTRRQLALIEDHDAGPSDPWLRQEPALPQWLGLGRHVYWYATDSDGRLLRKVLSWGFGLFNCMALAGRGTNWPPSRLMSARIRRLAEVADHVVVDAFDFEGTVVWSRARGR